MAEVTIPTGPLDEAPRMEVPGLDSIATARAIWRHSLRGLPLGAYDQRMAAWAEDVMDQPQLIAFASLLERARRSARPERLLSPGVAARRLGVQVKTLTRWADDGVIPVQRSKGGHRRYSEDDVEALRTSEAGETR